jgi:hypothetical protein
MSNNTTPAVLGNPRVRKLANDILGNSSQQSAASKDFIAVVDDEGIQAAFANGMTLDELTRMVRETRTMRRKS